MALILPMRLSLSPRALVCVALFLFGLSASAQPLLPPSDPVTRETTFANVGGDSAADLITRSTTGRIEVFLYEPSTGQFAASPSFTSNGQEVPWEGWEVIFADANGDGRADLFNRNRTNGDLFIHLNQGLSFSTFADRVVTGRSPTAANWRTLLGDIDGDLDADLCNIDLTNGTVFLHRNSGMEFEQFASTVQNNLAVPGISPQWMHLLADLDGNGVAEFVNFNRLDPELFGHRRSGNGFEQFAGLTLRAPSAIYEYEYTLAQVVGNAAADVIQHNLRTGEILVWETLSSGTTLQSRALASVRRNKSSSSPARAFRGFPVPEGHHAVSRPDDGLRHRQDALGSNQYPRISEGAERAP